MFRMILTATLLLSTVGCGKSQNSAISTADDQAAVEALDAKIRDEERNAQR